MQSIKIQNLTWHDMDMDLGWAYVVFLHETRRIGTGQKGMGDIDDSIIK